MNFSEFRRTGPISIIDPNVLDADSYGADTSIFFDDAADRASSRPVGFHSRSFCDSDLFRDLGNLLETISGIVAKFAILRDIQRHGISNAF